ncbi:DUF484 family protein [Pseudomonadota bacterium AL_CKDN230030165-1A_HGKHYDSX7]
MSTTSPAYSAQEIADFLQQNPGFFEEHAEVFSTMQIPSPHGNRAISLAERQILTLRERTRTLEWRLNELIGNADDNESISARITSWCARLLAEDQAAHVPGEIALGLAEQFDLDHAALRLWNLTAIPADGYGAPVSEDVRAFADSLKTPYCGNDTEFEAASWLDGKPRSLALVALRSAPEADAFGLLVLGSDDPARFTPEMGTAFLDTIGRLASAAAQRLARPPRA